MALVLTTIGLVKLVSSLMLRTIILRTELNDTIYLSDHRHTLLYIGSAYFTFLSHKPSGCLRDDHSIFVNISSQNTQRYAILPAIMPLRNGSGKGIQIP